MSVPRRGERGFTLLETMIALVILAVSMAALYESSGVSMRAIAASQAHQKARMLAETVLAEQTSIRTLKPGSATGRYEQFEWRATVEIGSGDWAALSKQAQWVPYLVTITVSWPPRKSLKLETAKFGQRQQ